MDTKLELLEANGDITDINILKSIFHAHILTKSIESWDMETKRAIDQHAATLQNLNILLT